MPTTPDVEAVLRGYVECAFWSSNDDDGTPLDENYGPDDTAPETIEAMRADCAAFLAANAKDFAAYVETYQPADWFGHDFWLTRNRHGAGFWDRGLGKLGDRLTAAANAFGESYLYVGDDGRIYVA